MEGGVGHCKFWLPKKKRYCSNTIMLGKTEFCGNHATRPDAQWIPCPIDPSHSVLKENLTSHVKRCPLLVHNRAVSNQPYYHKGINSGEEEADSGNVSSEMKRGAVYSMSVAELLKFIAKIKLVHSSICSSILDSYKIPEACNIWINRQVDRCLPFKEKHVTQQASILGNLEEVGVLKSANINHIGEHLKSDALSVDYNDAPAVVEFGAGKGYLTQMLADCYGVSKVFLVERSAYKYKADRSLRQKESLILERLRIDIEDLNLDGIESLQGLPFLAVGKHLCGPATDMTLRCCIKENSSRYPNAACSPTSYLRGLAIATCCHHLCQWKHYINKRYMTSLGITKEDFHAITWFTSWAIDADHSSDDTDFSQCASNTPIIKVEGDVTDTVGVLADVSDGDRALLGFMCKDIIDAGRLMWLKDHGLEAQFVKYVPAKISPENHLLIAHNKHGSNA